MTNCCCGDEKFLQKFDDAADYSGDVDIAARLLEDLVVQVGEP